MSKAMPGGFQAVESTLPDVVDYENFSDGETCVYRGHRDVKGRDGKMYSLQLFSLEPTSEPFAVWGTAQLDAKLREARAGTEIFVKYEGKTGHPSRGGHTIHNWSVGLPSRGSANDAEPGQRTTKRNPFAERRA